MSSQQDEVAAQIAAIEDALRRLRAIEWDGGGSQVPVLSVQAPASVQLDKTKPVTVTASAALDQDSPDDAAGADWTITGVSAKHFDGGAVPGGKISVPRGQRHGEAKWKMGAHSGPYFQNKGKLVLSNPNLVTLAADAVDVVISGGTQSNGWKTNSGLPWPSGVTTSSNDKNMFPQIDVFESWRGAKVDCLNCKSNGNKGWQELLNAVNQKAPVYAECARRNMLISQVIDIPDQEPDVINRIIGGDCDKQIKQIGLALMSYDKANGASYVIRLAHEIPFTPVWGPDKAGLGPFNQAWNHYAALLKQTIPGVRIEWNTLRNLGKYSLAQLYPGDDNVDVIGCDPYGNTDLPNDAAMSSYVSKFLQPFVAMARAKGKKIGFAEWALTNTIGPHSARDSIAYIRGMYNFFKANADIMSHEMYFHINDKSSQTGDHNHLLYGSDANSPDAAAEYKRLWSTQP